MSLYDDLGVRANASDAAIKSAHRAGVRRHHPDAGGDRHGFERMQRAYDILSDAERRRRYDKTGTYDQAPPPSEEQETMAALQAVLTEVIGGPLDLTRTDVIGTVIGALAARRDAARRQAHAANAAIARIGEARGRLSLVIEAASDPLAALFDHQLREAEALKLRVERALRAHDAAVSLITGYAYRIDADQASITYSYGQSDKMIAFEAPPQT